MIELSSFLHYLSIGLMTCISPLGVGLGQGGIALSAIKGINQQPSAQNAISRIAIFGMVLLEFAAIAGVTFGLLLVFGKTPITLPISIAELGIALAIAISGLAVGIACYFPAAESCAAVARQPFAAQSILRFMLIAQSMIQTPIVFSFIIGIFAKGQIHEGMSLESGIRLLSAGLCIGLGCVGPVWGLALFARNACKGIGINRAAYNPLLTFTFISQAIIETPLLFALVISLLIVSAQDGATLASALTFLAIGLCMGIGTLGPGMNSGRTAGAAALQIAYKPELYSSVSKASTLAQGLIDASVIYVFLIALAMYLLR